MSNSKKPTMNAVKIRQFEKAEAQLEGFYEEIGIISKRKPDDPLNKFKLNFINQMLVIATDILGTDYQPFPDFNQFDVETVPTASDVVTMLSQYLRAMDKFRSDNTYRGNLDKFFWIVSKDVLKSGEAEKIEARRPKNFDR